LVPLCPSYNKKKMERAKGCVTNSTYYLNPSAHIMATTLKKSVLKLNSL
jgi:hypothetical protein